jgi:bifunctional DNA-binding transcriptional regulator/antitoxin component of YhaV-PrlF toxin-antitoxin module
MAVVLDRRFRVLLPYFIRVQNNWEPGVRFMVLAAPIEGGLAALPTAHVAAVGEVGRRKPINVHGRLPLIGPGLTMDLSAGHDLTLVVGDGALRLSSPLQPAQPSPGVRVVLGRRWRLLLPYGIRVPRGPQVGIRLTVLAAPVEGFATAPTRYCRW